jgi:hypothetical protein
MNLIGSFYYNNCGFDEAELKQTLLKAIDHLIERLKDHIQFSEELDEEPDLPDVEESLLQEYRDESICLSGVRIKQFEEIRSLRAVFTETEPGSVSEAVLEVTNNIFKNLLIALTAELYVSYKDITPADKQELEKDLKLYAQAVVALGHDNVPTQLTAAYPFNDVDVVSFPTSQT